MPGACPCGSALRRIDAPHGRSEEIFTYQGVTVHPYLFRSAIGDSPDVLEYQVTQTERGADVAVVTASGEVAGIAAVLERALERVGVVGPEVCVRSVTTIERGPAGKLKRFIPLRPR